ncbi:MAG: VPLPA-CTERM sorting domain-containing protein [Chloroflexi bacterium]|nr:VPLPA-CTERM sorting domain-containing protein [Chloroflexota bacterium]
MRFITACAVVPLPASLPFLLAGLGGLALIARRR